MGGSGSNNRGYWTKRAKHYKSFNISSKNRISDVNWTDIKAKMDNFTKSRELHEKKTKSRAERAKKTTNSPYHDALMEEIAEERKETLESKPEPNSAFRYKKRRSFFHDQADKVSESIEKYSVEAPTEEEEDMLDEDMNLS